MSAEPVSIAEPPPSSCGHPLPSPQSVTSRKFSDTLQTDYFYRPGLAGAYGCNLKVSWYLRRNRTPGTSDCTKRPDFDASCCFDRTCTHQRRLIWDSRIMVRRQDRPDDSNFSQDTPDRPEIVLSYAWSGRAFPGGRPTLSLLVGLGDSSAQSGGPPAT